MGRTIQVQSSIMGAAPVHRIRVYVDTSVFGGVLDEEFAEASKRFFGCVGKGEYVVLLSRIVLEEIGEAPERVQRVLAELPAGALEEVPVNAEVIDLARRYVEAGVVGGKRIADATHVAAATVARADLVLSWNFKHLVDYDRIRKFNGVNALNGYPQIEIRSPLEVSNVDEDKDI